ncbi:discoidin domain-containing protein [Myxococcota bacterium]|nr:discoidin domain-containing protein [Myxococcota bacterium]
MSTALILAGLTLLAPAALARTLPVKDVSASSAHSDDSGVSYEAASIKDRKQSTAWFEGDSGSGLGAWVEVQLDGSQTVTGFRVWNGYWLTYDMWQRNNRAKEIEVLLSDGSQHDFTLSDEMKPQDIRFPKAVTTSSVKIRIKGIYKGTTFNDTALSELQVFNDEAESFVLPAGFTASSTYPADNDGDYEPDNLVDGVLDSMWCEGNKAGDGVGEWVEFDLGGSKKVSSLVMNNGNAYGFSSFMNANSATSATLTFSDGSKQQITIKPSMMDQTISFSPKTTSTVRITFDAIRKGKEFNDLCISEAHFLP